MKKRKGLFITFEGGEGVGKTTLIQSLAKYLRNAAEYEVVTTREPGGSPFGKQIREILLGSQELTDAAELFLFLADRSQHVKSLILPAIEDGKVVLCDRYVDSTMAYQGVARDADMALVEAACEYATGGLEPHVTFLLDLDPKIGISRTQKSSDNGLDRIEQEDLTFHEEVRKAYLQIARENPNRVYMLDASKPSDEVVKSTIAHLNKLLCPA